MSVTTLFESIFSISQIIDNNKKCMWRFNCLCILKTVLPILFLSMIFSCYLIVISMLITMFLFFCWLEDYRGSNSEFLVVHKIHFTNINLSPSLKINFRILYLVIQIPILARVYERNCEISVAVIFLNC